jgi:hypothetical protein
LVSKYPAEEWRCLAELINNGTFRKAMLKGVSEIFEIKPEQITKNANKKKSKPVKNLGALTIDDVSNQDEEKALLLTEVRDNINSATMKLTIGDLRAFAEHINLKQSLPSSKDQAIVKIVKYLATKEKDYIKGVLDNLPAGAKDLENSYNQWVNLILK